MKRKFAFISLVLMILLSAVVKVKVNAMIPISTEIEVLNPSTGNSNFLFSTTTEPIGTRFNATVKASNVTNLFAFQVYLSVNDSLLNITNAWLPVWDPAWIFNGVTTLQPAPAFYDFDTDSYVENVKIGDSMLFGDPVTGSGLLATIEFEIIYAPPSGSVSCSLDIDNVDTYPLDYDLNEVPAVKTSGYYEYTGPAGPEPPHAEFTYSPSIPFVGTTVTFNASASTPNGGELVSYTWDFDDGSPEVTESDPVTTHVYAFNGTFNVTLTIFDSEGLSDMSWQLITVLSELETVVDLNGDGKVDIKDIVIVALAFGSFPGHPRWNEIADLNKDEKIDLKDVLFIARNFGRIF